MYIQNDLGCRSTMRHYLLMHMQEMCGTAMILDSDHTGLVVGVMCAENHGLSGWWGGRVEPSSCASASITSMQVDMHAYAAGLARIKHADAIVRYYTV